MGKFTPSKAQEKAFDDVVKAFKKAKQAGLVFYGKSGSLVAYTRLADSYIEKDFIKSLEGEGTQIENLSSSVCITDSGADDYGCYITKEDEEYYLNV